MEGRCGAYRVGYEPLLCANISLSGPVVCPVAAAGERLLTRVYALG